LPPESGSLRILGSRVDFVTTQNTLELVERFIASGQPHHLITGNTLMLLEAERDAELRRILDQAALVVPESSGILWASHVLERPLEGFTPGIDLMLAICRMAQEKGHPAFLLGSAPGVAEIAGRALAARFPALRLAGTHHGYFQASEEPAVIGLIRRAKPSILFVGMGMPAQEKWIARHLESLGVPLVMGVGGSFDVLSGKLRRAPPLMRRAGVEWLYRLAQEPWRWRRIAQLPVFAWKVLRQSRAVSGDRTDYN
jgi:N-acetylglucosaminyldiphosphoundecaprenol N-acetyl-beta-D-mannosaminyltransferase